MLCSLLASAVSSLESLLKVRRRTTESPRRASSLRMTAAAIAYIGVRRAADHDDPPPAIAVAGVDDLGTDDQESICLVKGRRLIIYRTSGHCGAISRHCYIKFFEYYTRVVMML